MLPDILPWLAVLVLAIYNIWQARAIDQLRSDLALLDRALGPVEPSRGSHGLREVSRG